MTAAQWHDHDPEQVPLRHGLVAVYIPRGFSRADENKVRAALGLLPRRRVR
jgi:hypothetical protein